MRRFNVMAWLVVILLSSVAFLYLALNSYQYTREQEAAWQEEARGVHEKLNLSGQRWKVSWIFTNKDPDTETRSIEIWLWPAKHDEAYDYHDEQYRIYASEKALGWRMLRDLRLGQMVNFRPCKLGDPWEVAVPNALHGMELVAESIPKDDPRMSKPTAGTMAEIADWDGPLKKKGDPRGAKP